jgi:hypothetical protein
MAIVERYESPDRAIRLVIDLTDGDWTIGFDGFAWHTHGDILEAWGYHGAPDKMVRAFVQDIISSRKEICVYRIDGRISDIAVPADYTDRPPANDRYAPPNETMETRYWDDRPIVE